MHDRPNLAGTSKMLCHELLTQQPRVMMTSRLHSKVLGGYEKCSTWPIAKQVFFPGILEGAETAWKIKHLSRILTVLTLPNNVVTGSHKGETDEAGKPSCHVTCY